MWTDLGGKRQAGAVDTGGLEVVLWWWWWLGGGGGGGSHTRLTSGQIPMSSLWLISSSAEGLQLGKAPCVSVNWTLGDGQLEVVNTATGRRRDLGTPSRLCKRVLFARWRPHPMHSRPPSPPPPPDRRLMYSEAKMAARPYQAVKQQWVRSLHDAGLGTWVKKPPEQEHFLS
uniref:Adenosine deaminase RNA specific B2 (inactive) n=1 Tax=Gadus morhua TaxID=8049 RepID=A0A8C5FU37_GADMO